MFLHWINAQTIEQPVRQDAVWIGVNVAAWPTARMAWPKVARLATPMGRFGPLARWAHWTYGDGFQIQIKNDGWIMYVYMRVCMCMYLCMHACMYVSSTFWWERPSVVDLATVGCNVYMNGWMNEWMDGWINCVNVCVFVCASVLIYAYNLVYMHIQ